MTASALVIFLLKRRRERIFPRELGVVSVSEGIGEHIAWFIQLRWLAAILTAVAVFLSQHILHLLPAEVSLPLWLGVAVLWLINTAFNRSRGGFLNIRSYLLWLIATDVLILTHLLHFSGGLENSLFSIYVFHVIISGILLSREDAWRVAALIAALFLLLAFGEYSRLLSHYTLAVFPHAHHGHGASHASHQLSFVLGVCGSFLLLLGWTTHFTTAIMGRLRENHRRLLQTERLGALGQLVAYVAHEVNNPIGIISTRMKLARSGSPEYAAPEFLRETLEIVDRQSARVADVVRSLLNLSKPQLQPKTPVNLNEPLSEAVYLLSGRISGAGVALQEGLADSLPALPSRYNDLIHIFLNLLNNAVDAMPNGGLLRVESGCAGGWVHVRVSDTGPGIPPEELSRMFTPFHTTKSLERGTGLGLPISLALAKSLGGDIGVESSLGRGSSFTVRFPAP